MKTPPFLCSECGQPALPVLRLVDGQPAPVSRCCSSYLLRLKGAPTPREFIRQRRTRTA